MERLSKNELREAKYLKIHLKDAPSRVLRIWSVEDVIYFKTRNGEDRVNINGYLYESKKPTRDENDIVSETNGEGFEIERMEIVNGWED